VLQPRPLVLEALRADDLRLRVLLLGDDETVKRAEIEAAVSGSPPAVQDTTRSGQPGSPAFRARRYGAAGMRWVRSVRGRSSACAMVTAPTARPYRRGPPSHPPGGT
jgi:hypothetical protein